MQFSVAKSVQFSIAIDICTRCGTDRVPNPGRSACGDCPDGETETSPGVCTGPGSCGIDQAGTPPNCTKCGPGEVPSSDGRACGACGPGGAEKTAGSCTACASGSEPDAARTACRPCAADHAGTDGICTRCGTDRVPNPGRSACGDCPDGETETSPGVCTGPGSCGIDQAGTPPNCTKCGPGEVPSSDGRACGACGPGGAEKTAGSCTACASGSEPDAARTACRPCAADHAGTDGICTRCGTDCRTPPSACGPDGETETSPGVCTGPGSCGIDQAGTPPNCTKCGPGEVPSSDGRACGACGPGGAEKTAGSCTACASGSEPDAARTACRPCAADHAGTDGICTRCGTNSVPNPDRSACGDCPDGETETSPGVCTGGGTGGGTEGGTGHCTTLGNHYPGDEARCAPHGFVSTNGRCELAECPVNSTDDGAGVCVCAPGHVYDNGQPGLHGTTYNYPRTCTGRTVDLCGAAPDPGTCGPGGTWNSGRAVCNCGDGFERSDDGRSCVCADDGAEQTGYLASVLFPNPQSLFDGLRVGFVNTSSGNLTFRRRDIVTRAQGPAVFARVYDSRIAANYDFGPGWRLSLAEELLVDGDTAVYVDEAGARHAFARTGTAWTASPPTPRHAATTLDFADVDGIRIAVLADGDAVRTFEQADAAGARYVVRLVRTPARELVFDYDGGRLAAVSHDGATLFEVERDRDGRIAAVRDGHGRSVRYAYDADGRLETVRDIAGSDWHYLYRDDGLLGGAVDPEGRTYLAADYDAAGRAVRAFADGRLHDYAYAPEGTTVAEAAGEVHALTRNAAGVTMALSSTTGDSWSLTLDAANRVSTLTLPERTIGYAYGGHGRVATMTVADAVSGTTRMRSYDYDAQGRLVSASGGGADATVTYAAGLVRIDDGGKVFEYEVDDRGRVAWVQRGAEPEIRVERDQAGDVVEISQGHRSVRFGRDDLGRIVDAVFADGGSARYFYDDLGNRRLAEHGDGGRVVFSHDSAGALGGVDTTAPDGTVSQWTAAMPPDLAGRAAVPGSAVPTWDYDRDARVALAGAGEMGRMRPGSQGAVAATMAPADRLRPPGREPAQPRPRDARLAVLMGDRRRDVQSDYGHPAFGPRRRAAAKKPFEAAVPRLGDARDLASAARSLLAPGGPDNSGSAPNPVFLALEARIGELLRGADDGTGDAACESCTSEYTAVAAMSTADEPITRRRMPLVRREDAEYIRGGHAWGSTRIRFDFSSISCTAVCGGYRVSGTLKYTDDSRILNAIKIPPVDTCTAADRSTPNRAKTDRHEAKHAKHSTLAANAVVTGNRTALDRLYDSQSACEMQLESFQIAVYAARQAEHVNQENHVNHRGERKRTAVCRTPTHPSVEEACGVGDVDCDGDDQW